MRRPDRLIATLQDPPAFAARENSADSTVWVLKCRDDVGGRIGVGSGAGRH